MSEIAPRIAIIGPGRLGTGIGILSHRAGDAVTYVVGRSIESARRAVLAIGAGEPHDRIAWTRPVDVVWITTGDDELDAAIADLAARVDAGDVPPLSDTLVLHASGARSSAILAALRDRGARVASLHPLASFADPASAADAFAGTHCFFEGDAAARPELVRRIEAFGGIAAEVDAESKALYHAAAALASNGLVAMLDVSRAMMRSAGVDESAAEAAIVPLVAGTVRNVERRGIRGALTGPVERGDLAVIRAHVDALDADADPTRIAVYRSLARAAAELALARGSIDAATAGRIRGLLDDRGSSGSGGTA